MTLSTGMLDAGGIVGGTLTKRSGGLPPILEPTAGSQFGEAVAWLRTNREGLDFLLSRFGALTFRGFGLRSASDFDAFIRAYPTLRWGYLGGTSPRNAVIGNVMEATHAPADRVIKLHQEMAYARDFPAKLAFFCERPPASGGETNIGDMRGVTQRMDPTFRGMIRERGLLYRRFFRSRLWAPGHPKLDIVHRTWNEAFSTDDPVEVEDFCTKTGSTFCWTENGLIATFLAKGLLEHPHTGEEVLFNGFTGIHFSRANMGDHLYELHRQYYGDDHPLPSDVTFGDGEPLPEDKVLALIAQLDDATVAPAWEAGDVMIIDNLLTAHGRNAFTGTRLVRVALLS